MQREIFWEEEKGRSCALSQPMLRVDAAPASYQEGRSCFSSNNALNLKHAKVAAKARRLARLRVTSITAAVSKALEESLQSALLESATGQ